MSTLDELMKTYGHRVRKPQPGEVARAIHPAEVSGDDGDQREIGDIPGLREIVSEAGTNDSEDPEKRKDR